MVAAGHSLVEMKGAVHPIQAAADKHADIKKRKTAFHTIKKQKNNELVINDYKKASGTPFRSES